MKTNWNEMSVDIALIGLIALCVWWLLGPLSVCAQEQHGDGQERNWELMIGPAGFMMPAYPGSDEVEMMPFPFVFGEMSLGKAEAFIKVGDGAGMAITPIESTPQ